MKLKKGCELWVTVNEKMAGEETVGERGKVDSEQKLTAALAAMGHPVALMIVKKLSEPEQPPSKKTKEKRIEKVDKEIIKFFPRNMQQ